MFARWITRRWSKGNAGYSRSSRGHRTYLVITISCRCVRGGEGKGEEKISRAVKQRPRLRPPLNSYQGTPSDNIDAASYRKQKWFSFPAISDRTLLSTGRYLGKYHFSRFFTRSDDKSNILENRFTIAYACIRMYMHTIDLWCMMTYIRMSKIKILKLYYNDMIIYVRNIFTGW